MAGLVLLGMAGAAPLSGGVRLRAATGPLMIAKQPDAILLRYADAYLADRCRAGISITARVGQRTYYANRGLADRARHRPPTSDSVYELASVTKSFAGALAARAVVEGRMTLDADFRGYLPGRYPNLARAGMPITLRDLATHTSGLQRDLPDSDALFQKLDYDRIGEQLRRLNRGYTRARSLSDLHAVKLRSTPGGAVAYSNLGIRVLGYGLETVYRTPFERLLRRAILQPLGMASTGLTLTPAMRARLVTPYGRSGKVQPFHDASAGAAYGLYSTPGDMARYLAWQLNERDLVVARAHGRIRGTVDAGEGLIWNIGREDGARMLWHGGGAFGATSQMVLFPDRGDGFVLLANDSCEGSEAAMKAMAIAIERDIRG